MWMLMEGMLTLLAALGLGFLVWLLFGRLLHPIPGSELTVLLPGRDDGATLERDVRAVLWLRRFLFYTPLCGGAMGEF